MASSLLNIVHRANRGISVGLVGELDEAKTTAPTSVAVFDYNLLGCQTLPITGHARPAELTASST